MLRLIRIATAPCAVGLVDAIYLLAPEIRDSTPMSLFYVAVLIATMLGGFVPGAVAILLGLVSAWYLNLPPELTFVLSRADAASLLVYLITAVAVFLVAYRLLLAEGRALSLLDWLFARD